jgi:hypothetical protein
MKKSLAGIFAVGLLAGTTQLPAQTYTLTDLGSVAPETVSVGYGLNSAGQAAGTSSNPSGAIATLFSDGQAINLGLLEANDVSVATAINASTEVVGFEYFSSVPSLIRKQFLLSADGHTAGGVYLWEEEEAARSFMQQRVAPMIREKFQVEPTIEFYHSPVLVENGEPQKRAGVNR